MYYEILRLAIRALGRNAMRSLLTVLGIVIGVGAVIAMVTIGNGATAKVTADLAKLGQQGRRHILLVVHVARLLTQKAAKPGAVPPPHLILIVGLFAPRVCGQTRRAVLADEFVDLIAPISPQPQP